MRALLTQRIHASAPLTVRTLAAMVDALITRAQEGPVGWRERLDLVREDALGVRDGRRFKPALQRAGRPSHHTLDGVDVACQPDLDGVRVQTWATRRCVAQQGTAIFLGPPRTGKTPVAVALARAACPRRVSLDVTTRNDVAPQRKTAESRQPLPPTRQTELNPAVWVIAAGGALPRQRVEAHARFPGRGRRYARGRVLGTSHQACSEGAELGGEAVRPAVVITATTAPGPWHVRSTMAR